jgi:hypothetical protein
LCPAGPIFGPISIFLFIASLIIIFLFSIFQSFPCPLHPDKKDLKSGRDYYPLFSIYFEQSQMALMSTFSQMINFDVGLLFENF